MDADLTNWFLYGRLAKCADCITIGQACIRLPTMSEKQLSNKELKELKKQEKAARRAAQKAADGKDAAPGNNPASRENSQAAKGNSQANANVNVKKGKASVPSTSQIKKTINKPVVPVLESKVPSLLSHLTTREQRNAKLPLNVLNIIHPRILELAGKYSNYSIVGSINRCRLMLEVFKAVIVDYRTPENMTLTRNLTSYLSYQIDYLKNSRPLSITMGNAIRWLKQEISVLSIDLSEDEAKTLITQKIDNYIKEKIEYTDKMIIKFAAPHISANSTILTFGHSNVLEELFIHAHVAEKKNISVIILDSRPLFEGKTMLKNLIAHGISCKYYLLNSLSNVLEETKIDFVFLGAHAMLSNGRLYSRVGTALISMMSFKKNIPILVCCESIKFSERIQLDSVTQNELGDYENLMDLITDSPKKKNFALESFIKQKQLQKNSLNKNNQNSATSKQQKNSQNGKNSQNSSSAGNALKLMGDDGQETESSLKKTIESTANLKVLTIMYDLTPANYIDKIITELGALPPSSVPVILREYKSN